MIPPAMTSRSLRSILSLLICALGLAILACEGEPASEADARNAIRQQQASGDVAGTIEPLRAMIAEHPDDGELNYLYGRALVATGQFGLATWSLRQAMEDPEWREAAGIQLAQSALGSADFNEVVEVTTRILEDDPENALALLYRAQAQAHWKRDEEAALADATQVLELEPDLIEAYEPMILALLALERHDEANAKLAEAGERLEATDAPASALAWHCSTTAIFALEGGEIERGRETWERCLESFPADPNVVNGALEFFDGQREWPRSLELLRAAFEAAPDQRFIRNAFAARLRVTGQAAEGEALLREATEVEDPRLASVAWLDLAQYRHAMLEHGAAADAIARAIELISKVEDPGPQIRFQYADALVVSGQLDEALAVAEDISVAAQREMIQGRVAQERGEYARALELFDEALRVWPDNPWARYYAALAAEKVGDFDRALEEYRYAIRIAVGATDARTRAAKILIAEGQLQRAYQILFLERDKSPLEPEGELVAIYLMARVVNTKQLLEELVTLANRNPLILPAALARGADGVAEAVGAKAAFGLLREAPNVDYSHPYSAPALRAIVRYAHAAERPEEAESRVAQAVDKYPDAAVFQEIRGLHLELGGAVDSARTAYSRALELDPASADALAGLGRLKLEKAPAEAASLFDRAATADPTNAEPRLAAARALHAIGQEQAATERLEQALEADPFESDAAAELAALDLARDQVTLQTLAWARTAARFGGGADAFDRLSAVYTRLGRFEQAAKTAEHAKQLRERLDPAAEAPAAETAG
jgi:tetratricopeptide (TPR) repeat protein